MRSTQIDFFEYLFFTFDLSRTRGIQSDHANVCAMTDRYNEMTEKGLYDYLEAIAEARKQPLRIEQEADGTWVAKYMAEGPLGVNTVLIQMDGSDRRTAMTRLARFVDEAKPT
jgi:hypothetical protein